MPELIATEHAHRTKDRLLLLLKTRGELTTRALATALGISVPATRQHLRSLGASVTSRDQAGGVGRPAQVWSLTDAARQRFPDTHSELTVGILESLLTVLGESALEQVIDDRSRILEARYREALVGLSSLHGRLKRLAALRTEEGYLAELKKTDDGWLLVENHCPICAAARHCQGFCRMELELFQAVLGPGVKVTRTEYLLDGGQRCAYLVRR